jgi:hypothetical protein
MPFLGKALPSTTRTAWGVGPLLSGVRANHGHDGFVVPSPRAEECMKRFEVDAGMVGDRLGGLKIEAGATLPSRMRVALTRCSERVNRER